MKRTAQEKEQKLSQPLLCKSQVNLTVIPHYAEGEVKICRKIKVQVFLVGQTTQHGFWIRTLLTAWSIL